MEHRQATCLHADVCGYCRLISDDVLATVQTLTLYRAVIANLVAAHGGRISDVAGDSLLAEFPGVERAVQCAVDIQRELGARNAPLPPHRRLEYRVGIAEGPVLVDDGRLYGDCVNVAARVQEMAAPGSICVAGAIAERVGGALPFRLDYLGERAVKNIDRPVRIYRVDGRPRPEPAEDSTDPGATLPGPLCLGLPRLDGLTSVVPGLGIAWPGA